MGKQSLRPKSGPTLGKYLLFVIALFVVWKLYISFSIQSQPAKSHNDAIQMIMIDTLPTNELLQKIKSHIDSCCSQKIDNVTTLESTSILGTNTFQYNYLLYQ